MASGGRRVGAGRPKKAAAQKILEGNPGRRPVEVVNFAAEGVELPSEPPTYLSAMGKGNLPHGVCVAESSWLHYGNTALHLEEYAFCKARWLECEEMNTKHGLLVKDPTNGKAMPSPFVAMAQQYLKQTNEVWGKIYLVVRESKLTKWDEKNPNDDIMEKLLGGGG